jgi:crossover junction endodeoxyribonuclease RusA
MDVITFFVPGLPVAQPRQRTRVVATAGRTFTQNYTPSTHPVQDWKATIRLAASSQTEPMMEGPLMLGVDFVFPRPKSQTRKAGNVATWKATKPDWDNLGKALADALTGILWRDDAQLAVVLIRKKVAGDGDTVGTTVKVMVLE